MRPHDVAHPANAVPVLSHAQEGPLESWIDTCSTIFGIAPINRDDEQKDYRSQSWFLDPIMVSNSHYYSMAAERRNWHIQEAGAQIHVHRYTYGCASVESCNTPVECETGAVTLLDYCRPFRSVHTDNNCQSFFVPHDAINYRPSDAPHAVTYSPYSRIGLLIGQEMDNLLSQLRSGADFIDPDDIQRFLGCVEVAMSPQTASKSARLLMRASLKDAIQLFIEQRLGWPNLTTTLVLQNFGVSRATLYRMFEAEQGVRTYIGHRRLIRAVVDLASAPSTRGHIHKVAERWGFTSDASFNRVVRRRFGVAPGSLFQMPIQYANQFSPSSSVQALMLAKARTARHAFADA
ncbi:MAG: helix-turn-helix transcriptional regulator [Pseudomonadota bacterium]